VKATAISRIGCAGPRQQSASGANVFFSIGWLASMMRYVLDAPDRLRTSR
jgi:hypothetical protein